MLNGFLICGYLLAIVVANQTIHLFGPSMLPLTAFLMIPFDLVSRDFLHERWGKSWKVKMLALILSGSAISYLLNNSMANIAMASFVSFIIAGTVDTLTFVLMKRFRRVIRMNVSNIFSSGTDSIFFQLIAFGSISNSIAFEQTALKIFGGLVWTMILMRLLRR